MSTDQDSYRGSHDFTAYQRTYDFFERIYGERVAAAHAFHKKHTEHEARLLGESEELEEGINITNSGLLLNQLYCDIGEDGFLDDDGYGCLLVNKPIQPCY